LTGEKAFKRLQEEILKSYEDCSLLGWQQGRSGFGFGVLADKPSRFRSLTVAYGEYFPGLGSMGSNSSWETIQYSSLEVMAPDIASSLLRIPEKEGDTSKHDSLFSVATTARSLRIALAMFKTDRGNQLYCPLNIITKTGRVLAIPVSDLGSGFFRKALGSLYLIDTRELAQQHIRWIPSSIAFLSTEVDPEVLHQSQSPPYSVAYMTDKREIGTCYSGRGAGVLYFEVSPWNHSIIVAVTYKGCAIWSPFMCGPPNTWLRATQIFTFGNQEFNYWSDPEDIRGVMHLRPYNRHLTQIDGKRVEVLAVCELENVELPWSNYWQQSLQSVVIKPWASVSDTTSARARKMVNYNLRIQARTNDQPVDVQLRPLSLAMMKHIADKWEARQRDWPTNVSAVTDLSPVTKELLEEQRARMEDMQTLDWPLSQLSSE
jgi:hypothetical protein